MEYTVDEKKIVYENDIAHVVCYDSEDSDDLRFSRGILNGFIIELFAAIFIFAIVAVI